MINKSEIDRADKVDKALKNQSSAARDSFYVDYKALMNLDDMPPGLSGLKNEDSEYLLPEANSAL